MKRKNFFILTAILLSVSLLFSACGNLASGNETTDEKNIDSTQKINPADDDTLNILMIGNSGCYYYVEELYGMAEAAGIKMRVCNVYQSGTSVKQHWEWLQNGESKYFYYTTDENGRVEVQNTNLDYCLSQQKWDIITLQQAFWPEMTENLQGAKDVTKQYAKDLFAYVSSKVPYAKLMWHQTWAYQVGFDWRGTQPADQITDEMKVLTTEKQTAFYEVIRAVSNEVCQENGVPYIPVSDAWQLVRQDGYDNLCASKSVNNGEGDDLHDGDIGGGQYLNACVWFEIVTGESCVGNTYRPTYDLDANITYEALQQAAHQAVENLKNS